MHVLVMPGELTTAIGAIGDPQGVAELGLEGMAGVDRVVPILPALQARVVRARHQQPTIVNIDGRQVGSPETFCLIAGPAPSRPAEQTMSVAAAVARAGRLDAARRRVQAAHLAVRLQGLGEPALEILAEARAATGLPVVTELLDTQHADAISEHATSVQIGARTCRIRAARGRRQAGQARAAQRGLSSSLEELLQAADYILKEGNEAVMLCERGIRTFETATRFTLDLSAVPWLKSTPTCR